MFVFYLKDTGSWNKKRETRTFAVRFGPKGPRLHQPAPGSGTTLPGNPGVGEVSSQFGLRKGRHSWGIPMGEVVQGEEPV